MNEKIMAIGESKYFENLGQVQAYFEQFDSTEHKYKTEMNDYFVFTRLS